MRVLLNNDHTHNGIKYPAGTVLDMDAGSADWVLCWKVAVPAPEAESTPAEVAAAPAEPEVPAERVDGHDESNSQ